MAVPAVVAAVTAPVDSPETAAHSAVVAPVGSTVPVLLALAVTATGDILWPVSALGKVPAVVASPFRFVVSVLPAQSALPPVTLA